MPIDETPEDNWSRMFQLARTDRPNIHDTGGECPACGKNLHFTGVGMPMIHDKCPACGVDCVAELRRQWRAVGRGEEDS